MIILLWINAINGKIVISPPDDSIDSYPSMIFMIADGFGVASQTLARSVNQLLNPSQKLGESSNLPLDDMLVGAIKTRSMNRLVTDSAAGATAFASGIKTNNYYYGMDKNGTLIATLMEAAKLKGMLTAIIVTSNITHATPAAFVSHGKDRESLKSIARDIVRPFANGKPLIDIFMGGGRAEFIGEENISRIYDAYSRNKSDNLPSLLKNASKVGYKICLDRDGFDRLNPSNPESLPILGLYADREISFDIEIDMSTEPSLEEMVEKTLKLIDNHKNQYRGFFLMIEGSRIDMAAHDNDAATHVFEVLSYNRAVELCKNYLNKNSDNILLISTSDHETGGLALGRSSDIEPMIYPIPYSYQPKKLIMLKNRGCSLRTFATALIKHYCTDVCNDQMIKESRCTFGSYNISVLGEIMESIRSDVSKFFSIDTPQSIPKHFIERLHSALCKSRETLSALKEYDGRDLFLKYNDGSRHGYFFDTDVHTSVVTRALGLILSSLSQISWATPGHTGQDVMLYAMGPTADKLRGCHESTYLFTHIREFLGLNITEATKHIIAMNHDKSS